MFKDFKDANFVSASTASTLLWPTLMQVYLSLNAKDWETSTLQSRGNQFDFCSDLFPLRVCAAQSSQF